MPPIAPNLNANTESLGYPWEKKERSDSDLELQAIVRESRRRLVALGKVYPAVWHMEYTLSDYSNWILSFTTEVSPSIYDLTYVCLAVRAATDTAEYNWSTTNGLPEVVVQIRALIPAVQKGLDYVSRRYGLADNIEQIRLVYASHIRNNLLILETLVDTNLDQFEKNLRITQLRDETSDS